MPMGGIQTALSCSSGIKHLEEIRTAGLKAPAVNQIEVGANLRDCHRQPCSTRDLADGDV